MYWRRLDIVGAVRLLDVLLLLNVSVERHL